MAGEVVTGTGIIADGDRVLLRGDPLGLLDDDRGLQRVPDCSLSCFCRCSLEALTT